MPVSHAGACIREVLGRSGERARKPWDARLVPGAHHEQALGVVHALQVALQRLGQVVQLQVLHRRPRQPLVEHLRAGARAYDAGLAQVGIASR